MFDVDESVDESGLLGKDPIALDELNEDEVKHHPFKFLHHDEIPFFKIVVWFDDLVGSKV
jgi:hypothetical protein